MNPILEQALHWHFDHAIVWLLPVVFFVYARGFSQVHELMPGRYPPWRLGAFTVGLGLVFLAVASPIDHLGELLLSVHMTQHMLLMMAAPPLLWLGQPIVPMLRGLPPRCVKRAFGSLITNRRLRRIGRAVTNPAFCWASLAITNIVWHLPQLYERGLHSEGWHEVQHSFFFTAALLFWWPVIRVWPDRDRWPRWTVIPYLVSADLINTALSAVLSFSNHVIYTTYETVPRVTSLSPIDDQALAGVIMWVPGSIAFLLPAVVFTMQLFEPRASWRRDSTWARADAR